MKPQTRVYLGQLLVQKGIITAEQLALALSEQRKSGQLLGSTLIAMGFIKDDQVLWPVLAESLGYDFINLKQQAFLPHVLARIPAKAVNHYKVFPVTLEQGVLTLAMSTPWDISTVDDIAAIAQARINPVLAGDRDILEAIRDHYGVGAETIERLMSESPIVSPAVAAIEHIDEESSEASISHFLNQILYQAHRDKATDIHIEPFGGELSVRYRIDGILYDAKVPENIRFFQDALISRIKILANLNIAEKRLPQDGRFKVKVNEANLDLRVSFLPTGFGESCVIRLLNAFRLYDFKELGFDNHQQQLLDRLLGKPHGIIFLTGPTGSGKTTTLYSCLAAVNTGDTKIITVEDPVEYQLKGVVQIQANAPIGLSFSVALRSILRNDPDVIMIGEVRDAESAQIAIQMALTGHLVFSTLHTNDAASGVTRLIDIGIEPYLIASSVECFIAQRLVRLLCPNCKKEAPLTEQLKADLGLLSFVPPVVFEGVGCKLCRMTGYMGRAAISEFLVLNDAVRDLIVRRATSVQIKQAAVAAGMKTLRQHGWEKVAAGLTSPSEVLRATEG